MSGKLISLIVLLAIGACSQIQPSTETNADAINFHAWWQALPPASFARQVQLEQVISGRFGEKEFQLQAALEVDQQHFVLVALSAFGHRVLTISYTANDNAQADKNSTQNSSGYQIESSPFVPGSWDGRYLLADLQLALWPLEPLQQALQQSVFQLSESDDQLKRQLWQNDQLILEIRYASPQHLDNTLRLSNLQHHYELDISTQILPTKQ